MHRKSLHFSGRNISCMERTVYDPRRRNLLGPSHLADRFLVYEPGRIAVLGEKSSVGASNVINSWLVGSVTFILHIQLTQVITRSIICWNPAQLQEPLGYARV